LKYKIQHSLQEKMVLPTAKIHR